MSFPKGTTPGTKIPRDENSGDENSGTKIRGDENSRDESYAILPNIPGANDH